MPEDELLENERDMDVRELSEFEFEEIIENIEEEQRERRRLEEERLERERIQNEARFAEIEREVQARRQIENEQYFRPDTKKYEEQIPLHRRTTAEVLRLSEKSYFREMAASDELPKLIEEFNKITTYPDGEVLSGKDRYQMEKMTGLMDILRTEWKQYTNAYLQPKTDRKLALEEAKLAGKFKQDLDQILKEMQEFSISAASNAPAYSHIFSYLTNLEGHYDEMMNGSMTIPKGTAEYRLNNPSTKGTGLDQRKKNFQKELKKDNLHGDMRFLWEDRSDEPLFPHEPSASDIVQNGLGNCYFLSGLAAVVSNNPQAIRDMFHDNGDGTVTVRLYEHDRPEPGADISYKPFYIRVDKSTPIYEKTVEQKDGRVDSLTNDTYAKNSLWVQLLEKAFAASGLHGKGKGYVGIESGMGEDALEAILGPANLESKMIDGLSTDKKFQRIKDAIADGHFITGGTSSKTEIPQEYINAYREKVKNDPDAAGDSDEAKETRKHYFKEAFNGVLGHDEDGELRLSNHEYSIVGASEVKGKKYVIVREPNSTTEVDTNGNIVFDGENGDIAKGYLALPLEQFDKMFTKVMVFKPMNPEIAEDSAQEIRTLANVIHEGLNSTRSLASKMTFSRFESQEFRDLYYAAEEVKNLSNELFPSKTKLEKAVEKLTEASEKYYTSRKPKEMDDADHNLRVTLAKTGMNMKNIYDNRKSEYCGKYVRMLEEEMLMNRIAFSVNVKPEERRTVITGKQVASDPALVKVIKTLKEEELVNLTMRTKPEKLPKAVLEQAALKKNSGRAEEASVSPKKKDAPTVTV